jgi:SepF-like predicted cell division protein (DUF552 family)
LSNLGKMFGRVIHRSKKIEEIKPSESPSTQEKNSLADKVYLKAFPLRKLSDVDVVKQEVSSGNIMILKISPLAAKNIEDAKRAVNELCEFTQTVGGDIARLGEERVVVTPSSVRIWREKKTMPAGEMPTAA